VVQNAVLTRATALETKGAAKTYQALVRNALESFSTLLADETTGAINWDKADFELVSQKADFLAHVSVKAYEQCKQEI